MIVGAYDPDAWAGLVLSDQPGRGFALRCAIEREGARADGADLLYLVHEVGPHDPNGAYARVAFDTELPFGRKDETPVLRRADRHAGLTVEWARTDTGAVLRARVAYDGVLELRGYFPWDWAGTWSAGADGLIGESRDRARTCRVAVDRTGGHEVDGRGEAVLRFDVRPGDAVHAAVSMGPADAPRARADAHAIAATLAAAAEAYDARRVTAEGAWVGLPDAIANNLHWMVALQPETGRRYVPAGRRWIFPRADGGREHWTLFEWDAFFNALELDLESPELARSTVEAVLATQYENGCVPNWRGRFFGTRDRSQPPVGAFATLSHCLRTGDRELLAGAFPPLERWHAWWSAPKRGRPRRDGNANGLYEWGSDDDELRHSPAAWENRASGHQRAAWESGQDDLPNWDDARWNETTETLELDAVDLNSYLALDCECLAAVAEVLGETGKAERYRARRAAIGDAMNAHLWDETHGLYLDRHWDGRRSTRVAAPNFLPLLAGFPSPDQAERMLATLLDPTRFWGQWVVPTIARDDPAFADQQYWRGTIWPPTNYLLYQGLRRYGFDRAAADLATKSVALFLETWREYALCRENYDARTGAGGGQRYQSWGPLFALIGIHEFVDVTPWDGLRIGTPAPVGRTTLRRLPVAGHRWTITLAPDGLRAEADGALVLESDHPLVARHVRLEPGTLEAGIVTAHRTTVRTALASQVVEPGTHTVRLAR